MNPTDQARKEARRRELKKNKKQRQTVRTAVLKGKNPREIIEELEKIDDMEFNPVTPCPLNQKVMAEKRRKLSEMWERVISLYQKDNPDQYADLKKLWLNYSARKIEVVRYYESVVQAQEVEVDTIPLPEMGGGVRPSSLHTPTLPPGPPRSVLKKPPSVLEPLRGPTTICPGVPSVAPPPLSDYVVEDPEPPEEPPVKKRSIRFGDTPSAPGTEADISVPGEAPEKQVTGLQKKMLAMAGQDLDQFMREMEEVHRQSRQATEAEVEARLARLEAESQEMSGELGDSDLPPGLPPHPNSGMHFQGMPGGQRVPLRPGQPPPGVRPPPGPPPGVPPRAARPPLPRPFGGGLAAGPGGVLSAKPQINKGEGGMSVKTDKVISGAPVMRNLKSDVTRFVPTNLRVRREGETGGSKQGLGNQQIQRQQQQQTHHHPVHHQQPKRNKDDAYAEFMKEMQDLL